MTEIVWCDPPMSANDARKWAVRLLPVMEKPSTWALVETHVPRQSVRTIVKRLRNGETTVPPGRWEFRVGKHDDAYGVWARYLGPELNPGFVVQR